MRKNREIHTQSSLAEAWRRNMGPSDAFSRLFEAESTGQQVAQLLSPGDRRRSDRSRLPRTGIDIPTVQSVWNKVARAETAVQNFISQRVLLCILSSAVDFGLRHPS